MAIHIGFLLHWNLTVKRSCNKWFYAVHWQFFPRGTLKKFILWQLKSFIFFTRMRIFSQMNLVSATLLSFTKKVRKILSFWQITVNQSKRSFTFSMAQRSMAQRARWHGGEPPRLLGQPGQRDKFQVLFIWDNSGPPTETEIVLFGKSLL